VIGLLAYALAAAIIIFIVALARYEYLWGGALVVSPIFGMLSVVPCVVLIAIGKALRHHGKM
jgi:hypothetical protein